VVTPESHAADGVVPPFQVSVPLQVFVEPKHFLGPLLHIPQYDDDDGDDRVALQHQPGLSYIKLKATPCAVDEVARHFHDDLAATHNVLVYDVGGGRLTHFKVPLVEAQLNGSNGVVVPGEVGILKLYQINPK
jgi:hypothetical protein